MYKSQCRSALADEYFQLILIIGNTNFEPQISKTFIREEIILFFLLNLYFKFKNAIIILYSSLSINM